MSELTPAMRNALDAAVTLFPSEQSRRNQNTVIAAFLAGVAYATKRDAAICRTLKETTEGNMARNVAREECAQGIEEADR